MEELREIWERMEELQSKHKELEKTLQELKRGKTEQLRLREQVENNNKKIEMLLNRKQKHITRTQRKTGSKTTTTTKYSIRDLKQLAKRIRTGKISNEMAETLGKLGINKKQRSNQQTLKLATCNLQGSNKEGCMQHLAQEYKKYDLDILAIQEINKRGITITEYESLIWCMGGGERNILGTGFILKKELEKEIVDFKAINDRLSILRLRGTYRKISIINVHAPTEVTDEDTKQDFYDTLEDVMNSIPNFDIKIIIGDCNAQIGKEQRNAEIAGKESLHNITNKNGQILIDFAASNRMIIKSTRQKRKDIHKATWMSPNRKTFNQIDHLLIEKIHEKLITKVRTYRGADINSDHMLLIAKLQQKRPTFTNLASKSKPLWNNKCINFKKYVENTQSILASKKISEEINKEWNNIKETITASTKKSLELQVQKPKKEWIDDNCKKAIQKRKELRMKMLENNTPENIEKYKHSRNDTQKLIRNKKREFQEEKLKTIAEHYKNKNPKLFYRGLKNERKGYQPPTIALKDEQGRVCIGLEKMLEIWEQFFRSTATQEDKENQDEQIPLEGETGIEEEPTEEELIEAIRYTKNEKSPGHDGIIIEQIKQGSAELLARLHKLIKQIWKKQSMPVEWNQALIYPIHKKGNMQNPENYRPIALLNVTYKLLAKIINNRLQTDTQNKIGQYQAGFRSGKSTVNHIFMIRQIQEKLEKKNIPIHTILIDFKQAFDRINRSYIFNAMQNLQIPKKLIQLTKMTLQGTNNKITYQGQLSSGFTSNTGVKQGDPLSPTLFNITLENIIREAKIKTSNIILKDSYQLLAFADDVVIASRTKEELKIILTRFESAAKKAGLIINQRKSSYMILGNKNQPENLNLKIKNENNEVYKFNLTNSAVYLGTELTSKGGCNGEIKRRITAGKKSAGALNKVLRDKNVSTKSKIFIYKSIIRPSVTYASETWTVTEQNKKSLEIFERRILRRIYGGKKDNGNWRSRTNEELKELYKETGIARIITQNRLRWLGHITRLPEDDTIKTTINSELPGRNRKGRPRKTWWDNIKEDVAQYNLHNWKNMARNRKLWKTKIQAIGLLA